MGIARYYDDSKNPDGGALPGVPLDDISEDQFALYPEHIQRSIDAHAMYRKTKPAPETKAKPTAKPKAPVQHRASTKPRPASTEPASAPAPSRAIVEDVTPFEEATNGESI